MWRSVFLHEFIDHRISNFRAVAGHATADSLALTPNPDPVSGINSVEITPRKGFEYLLDKPLRQVIGFSCRVRLSYPILDSPHLDEFPLMQLGGADSFAIFSLAAFHHPLPDLSGTLASASMFVGPVSDTGAATGGELGVVKLPARTFTELRFDWHASGQARLAVDGRLVGYNNAVAPGMSLNFDRVVFGMPGPFLGTVPKYLVARVFVRVLLRLDSLALLSKLLPIIETGQLQSPAPLAPPELPRCFGLTMGNLLNLLDRLRSFMATIHQTTSQPWSQQHGPVEGPFRPEATRAHELAVATALALSKMLRTGDFSAPDSFLEPFTEFLRILRAAQPGQFDALVAELGAADVVPETCRELFERSLEENKRALEPITMLLSAASERVREISGGN